MTGDRAGTEHVVTTVADRIATILVDRPAARNALDAATLDGLVAAIEAADADDAVDVLVLTGSDPVFCAGLDLRALEAGADGFDIGSLTQRGNPWPVRTKPLVGAINGPAITGGLELALYCDILVASEKASFGDTHAQVGIMPFWGMSVLLPQAVGHRTAVQMSLTGRFLSAEDAFRLGMVSAVVPHGQLMERAAETARDVRVGDQPAVRALLAAYRDTWGVGDAEARAAEQGRAREWQSTGFDAAEIGRRRVAIQARGRAQKK